MATTLTVSEILTDVLEAFKLRVPALNYFATDMSAEQTKYGQTIIAHIPTLPTAYDHTAAQGYNENAQNARDLLTDVPVVMNVWKHVTIKMLHDDVNEDRSKNYLKSVGNAGYVLGKAVVDYALSKALETNFSRQTLALTDDTDFETLQTIRADMNARGAGTPRYGLVNSATFNALESDPRIASGDYYGQRTGSDPIGKLVGLAGFNEVMEYPDFPTNSENLAGLFFDPRAVVVATRLPNDSVDLAGQMGIPTPIKKEVITDAQSGLSLAGFGWFDANTHNLYVTATIMYGATAGKQAGSAGTLCDYAGHLLATS
jgi:hypothetical protein